VQEVQLPTQPVGGSNTPQAPLPPPRTTGSPDFGLSVLADQ